MHTPHKYVHVHAHMNMLHVLHVVLKWGEHRHGWLSDTSGASWLWRKVLKGQELPLKNIPKGSG